ncbi:MAG: CRISPR-associated protein Cas4 [Eubacteriales bacterium]|nr:CRISPR-associated protein Cas4 [Eubacteriales bacterium]
MAFREEEFLQLSGLQHFIFCRRQWALIHIEQQWAENFQTMDGKIMHKNAHDGDSRETRGDCIITRGMKVHSSEMGISGECDIVEFHRSDAGIPLKDKNGIWLPYPVEYKRGKPGNHTKADACQLCAQAMCLEEMLCCEVPEGALFYGEVRRRHTIVFSEEMRSEVRGYLKEMHRLFERGYTPKGKLSKACKSCSLNEVCVPTLVKSRSVDEYIRDYLEERP